MILNYILYLLSLFMSFIILPLYIIFLIYTLVISYYQLSYFWLLLLVFRLFILLSVYIYIFYCIIIKYYWPEKNQFDNYLLKSSIYIIKLKAAHVEIQEDLKIIDNFCFPEIIKKKKIFFYKIQLVLKLIIVFSFVLNFFFKTFILDFLFKLSLIVLSFCIIYNIVIDWKYKISRLDYYGLHDFWVWLTDPGLRSELPWNKNPQVPVDKGPLNIPVEPINPTSVPVEPIDPTKTTPKKIDPAFLKKLGVNNPKVAIATSRLIFLGNGTIGFLVCSAGFCLVQQTIFTRSTSPYEIVGDFIQDKTGFPRDKVDVNENLKVELEKSKTEIIDLKAQLEKVKEDSRKGFNE